MIYSGETVHRKQEKGHSLQSPGQYLSFKSRTFSSNAPGRATQGGGEKKKKKKIRQRLSHVKKLRISDLRNRAELKLQICWSASLVGG